MQLLDGYREQDVVLEVYRELSKKYNLPVEEIRRIIRSFYNVTAKLFSMTELNDPETHERILNKCFGVFEIHKAALTRRLKRQERENNKDTLLEGTGG